MVLFQLLIASFSRSAIFSSMSLSMLSWSSSSSSSSSKRPEKIIVMQVLILKSVASIVISTESGISRSRTLSFDLWLASVSSSRCSASFLALCRLSERPGKAIPTTTVFLPSEMTEPLSTSTFFTLSLEKMMPVIVVKGTKTSLYFSELS